MLNRRSFFSALSGLPFIGAAFRKASPPIADDEIFARGDGPWLDEVGIATGDIHEGEMGVVVFPETWKASRQLGMRGPFIDAIAMVPVKKGRFCGLVHNMTLERWEIVCTDNREEIRILEQENAALRKKTKDELERLFEKGRLTIDEMRAELGYPPHPNGMGDKPIVFPKGLA